MVVQLFLNDVYQRSLTVRTRRQGEAVAEAWILNDEKRTAILLGHRQGKSVLVEEWSNERLD